MNVTVKLLNELDPPVPTFEIIFIRMSITWLFSFIVMYNTRVPHAVFGPPGVRHLLAIRGFSGFFGMSEPIQMGGMPDHGRCRPIWHILLARLSLTI
jgi:hypothetical protein